MYVNTSPFVQVKDILKQPKYQVHIKKNIHTTISPVRCFLHFICYHKAKDTTSSQKSEEDYAMSVSFMKAGASTAQSFFSTQTDTKTSR